MNTQSLIAAIAFAFAGNAAMAQDITVDPTPFQATKTRAEVRAEVLQASAAGVLQSSSDFEVQVRPVAKAAPSMLTREQVRAEARAELRANRRADESYGTI